MLNKIFSFLKLQDNASKFENISDELNSWLNSDLTQKSNLNKFDKFLNETYFVDTDNLTEKKYKLICLHLFLEDKELFINNMPLMEKKIESISTQLFEGKETQYEIKKIFNKETTLSKVEYDFRVAALREIEEETNLGMYSKVKDTNVYIKDLLKEDENHYEKINVSKNIYKDFSNCGILANKLKKNKEQLSIVLELQNYKLEPNDYKSLEKYIEEGNVDYYIHPNTKASIWNELINNENSIENLNLIKKFIVAANMSSFGLHTNEKDEPAILNNIEAKITYIELHGEMLEDKPTTSKSKKIKL